LWIKHDEKPSRFRAIMAIFAIELGYITKNHVQLWY
jgi:hypothetical protein